MPLEPLKEKKLSLQELFREWLVTSVELDTTPKKDETIPRPTTLSLLTANMLRQLTEEPSIWLEDKIFALRRFTPDNLKLLKKLPKPEEKKQRELYFKIEKLIVSNEEYKQAPFVESEVKILKTWLTANDHQELSSKLSEESLENYILLYFFGLHAKRTEGISLKRNKVSNKNFVSLFAAITPIQTAIDTLRETKYEDNKRDQIVSLAETLQVYYKLAKDVIILLQNRTMIELEKIENLAEEKRIQEFPDEKEQRNAAEEYLNYIEQCAVIQTYCHQKIEDCERFIKEPTKLTLNLLKKTIKSHGGSHINWLSPQIEFSGFCDFTDCGITDEEVPLIIRLLMHNPNITGISLKGNPDLNEKSIRELITAAGSNSSCSKLYLTSVNTIDYNSLVLELEDSISNLDDLDLGNEAKLTDTTIEHLKKKIKEKSEANGGKSNKTPKKTKKKKEAPTVRISQKSKRLSFGTLTLATDKVPAFFDPTLTLSFSHTEATKEASNTSKTNASTLNRIFSRLSPKPSRKQKIRTRRRSKSMSEQKQPKDFNAKNTTPSQEAPTGTSAQALSAPASLLSPPQQGRRRSMSMSRLDDEVLCSMESKV